MFQVILLELILQLEQMYTVDLRHETFDIFFTTIQSFLKSFSNHLQGTVISKPIKLFQNIWTYPVEPTVDGSEIRRENHMGCIKPYKNMGSLPYQLV